MEADREINEDNSGAKSPLLHNRMITPLLSPVSREEIPQQMPSPMSDRPHPLARRAAEQLQERLQSDNLICRDFHAPGGGKMFGVLVVEDGEGEIGFLSAFSGQMSGSWHVPGFVPPLFDPAEHGKFLPAGKNRILAMERELKTLEHSETRAELSGQIIQLETQRDCELETLKQQHRIARDERRDKRSKLIDLESDQHERAMARLALASQRDKRERINCKQYWREQIEHLQQQLDQCEATVNNLREARASLSRQLQQQVFSSYILNNALRETVPMADCFEVLPPAGSGDCAAPKLLHYAHAHELKPLALAEFWWGASPTGEIRHHGHYYPACRGKCRPILPFMLRGLAVQPEPTYAQTIAAELPETIYEDEYLLLVNKPAGLMSAPGKEIRDSVLHRLSKRYPDNHELRLVHRLDMATSGLLLVAKSLRINKALQKQFIQRSVEKRYEAILNGAVSPESGEINLPLRTDFDDRPRQLVCFEHGKEARTRWQVIAYEGDFTRIHFYPETGRTHQLRMHASHRDGLNAAIVGDALYGDSAERLMLHAERLCFRHPVTRQRLEFQIPAPF